MNLIFYFTGGLCNLSFSVVSALCSLLYAEDLMSPAFKHYMNPLHVYCRLRDLGMPKGPACFLCKFYERMVFRRYILKTMS